MGEPIRHADDVDMTRVRRGAALIVFGVALALFAAWLTMRLLQPHEAPAGMAIAPPRLETAPQPDRAAYDAEKARLIGSYGWVDRKAGIAHIPVEEAMRLLAARHAAEGKR